MKYTLPTNVKLAQDLPDSYTKETKLEFIDSQYGPFKSHIKAMEDAGKRVGLGPLSTHPQAIIDRRKATNIQKYGSISPASSKEVQARYKNTIKQRYGVANISSLSSVKEKKKNTLLNNYGVSNPMHSEEVKFKVKKTVKNKYKVNNVAQADFIKEKMKATSLKRYGTHNPMHNELVKEKQLQAVVSKYDDNGKLNMLPNGKYISEYCKLFDTNPCSQYANYIYRNIGPEAAQNWIENHKDRISNLELTFLKLTEDLGSIRWDRKIFSDYGYRPDIKISDTLFVDLDGLLYHSERYKKDNSYHQDKRLVYEKEGKTLLQFRQDELIKSPHIIKSMINLKFNKVEKKAFARKLTIKPVDIYKANEFLEVNHLMGGVHNAKSIGLWDNNELLMLVCYKHYKKDKESRLELDRVCTKINTLVVGGLSRLLSFIIKEENPIKIVSFVDLRYADGHSLVKLGFIKEKEHLSWKWTDGHYTYNRRRALTRKEADKKGWYRIYDAGQAKFILDLAS